jgi:hypothetical protein
VQRPGRHHDQRPVVHFGQWPQQQRVEPARGVGEQRGGRGERRGPGGAAGIPARLGAAGLEGDREPQLDQVGAVRGGMQSACWPAAVEPVVAVAAADPDGKVPPWSAALPWVRCKAPGVDVIGDYFTGPVLLGNGLGHFEGRAMWSGTSFAAAIASGAVAARTVPGSTGPRDALEALLKDGTLVREL